MYRDPLRLRIPEPRFRPGDHPDFANLQLSEAGAVRRPKTDAPASEVSDLAFGLVGVLDDQGNAVGPWNPELDSVVLRRALRAMMLTRAYDERMYRAQRQGKTSFYMKCTGEEAVAAGQAFALSRDDMLFPTYRQQGLLIARDWPLVDMMCQVYSNAGDRLKGRQMPVFYSSREAGFFSISGNLGTQFSQAVGWAMASAYKSDRRIASACGPCWSVRPTDQAQARGSRPRASWRPGSGVMTASPRSCGRTTTCSASPRRRKISCGSSRWSNK